MKNVSFRFVWLCCWIARHCGFCLRCCFACISHEPAVAAFHLVYCEFYCFTVVYGKCHTTSRVNICSRPCPPQFLCILPSIRASFEPIFTDTNTDSVTGACLNMHKLIKWNVCCPISISFMLITDRTIKRQKPCSFWVIFAISTQITLFKATWGSGRKAEYVFKL